MPVFEYRCRSCGERFEVLVPRAGHVSPPCVRCGAGPSSGTPAERLISTFSVGRSPAAASTTRACGPHCACHGD